MNERVMASGDPLDEVGAEAAPDAASVAAALSEGAGGVSDGECRGGRPRDRPTESAEDPPSECAAGRRRVGADDADAAMPPTGPGEEAMLHRVRRSGRRGARNCKLYCSRMRRAAFAAARPAGRRRCRLTEPRARRRGGRRAARVG